MPTHEPPTIEMTLAGEVIAPPSRWTRLLGLWRALPAGSVPLLLVAFGVVAVGAVLLLGFLLVIVPVVLLGAVLAFLFGGARRRPT